MTLETQTLVLARCLIYDSHFFFSLLLLSSAGSGALGWMNVYVDEILEKTQEAARKIWEAVFFSSVIPAQHFISMLVEKVYHLKAIAFVRSSPHTIELENIRKTKFHDEGEGKSTQKLMKAARSRDVMLQ